MKSTAVYAETYWGSVSKVNQRPSIRTEHPFETSNTEHYGCVPRILERPDAGR